MVKIKAENHNSRNAINLIHRRKKSIAFIFIVIIFIIIILYGQNYTTPSSAVGNITNNTVILKTNTVFSLEPGHYTYVEFSVPTGTWNLKGSVTSSTSATIYVLNSSQFSEMENHKSFSYVSNVFANSGGEINATIQTGNYFLVLYNYNSAWGVGIEVTSNFVLTRLTQV